MWLAEQDSNLRPHVYKTCALAYLSYPPTFNSLLFIVEGFFSLELVLALGFDPGRRHRQERYPGIPLLEESQGTAEEADQDSVETHVEVVYPAGHYLASVDYQT